MKYFRKQINGGYAIEAFTQSYGDSLDKVKIFFRVRQPDGNYLKKRWNHPFPNKQVERAITDAQASVIWAVEKNSPLRETINTDATAGNATIEIDELDFSAAAVPSAEKIRILEKTLKDLGYDEIEIAQSKAPAATQQPGPIKATDVAMAIRDALKTHLPEKEKLDAAMQDVVAVLRNFSTPGRGAGR